MYFENGDEYNGAWENGKMHGKGIYTYRDGKTFEGTWVSGVRWVGEIKLPTNSELGYYSSEDYS